MRTENAIIDSPTKLIKSERRVEQLSFDLHKAQPSLADYVDFMKNKRSWRYEIGASRRVEEGYVRFCWNRSESDRERDRLTISCNVSKAYLDQSKRNLVEFYVEKRQLFSQVDRLRIEQTSFERKVEFLEYRHEIAFAKEKP